MLTIDWSAVSPGRNTNRSNVSRISSPRDGACRSVSYAPRPALRLVYEYIKPIRPPYLDVGFRIGRCRARGGKRGSQALKMHRCRRWRARQYACAGEFDIDTNTQHYLSSISERGRG